MMMKRFLLLIIGVLVLCSATFAQAKKMRLTVNLQNALLNRESGGEGESFERRDRGGRG